MDSNYRNPGQSGSDEITGSFISGLFKDEEKKPTEKNPFCNDTETSSYNEDYSKIIPDFFFMNTGCPLKPSADEKKRLRYYYNITGIILTAGLMIFMTVFIFVILFSLTLSYSAMLSVHSFGYLLKNQKVIYSSLTIASVLSVPVICAAGTKFSGLSFSEIFKSNHNMRTSEILCCIMTGLFLYSAGEVLSMLTEYFLSCSFSHQVRFSDDIYQIIIILIFKCLVVPVSQGIIFRGIALKNLSRAGQKFGILTVSMLCALSSFNAVNLIPAFLFSVMLSKMTVKYNTPAPGIAVHIVINTCSMLINLYRDLMLESDAMVNRLWTVITLLSGVAFAACYILKERLPRMLPEQKKRTIPLFLTSPAAAAAVLIYAAITAADVISFIL